MTLFYLPLYVLRTSASWLTTQNDIRAADDGRLSLPRHHDDGATAAWRPDSANVLRRPATHPQYSEFCWIKFKIDDGEPLVIEDDGEPLVVIEDTVGTILLTDVDN